MPEIPPFRIKRSAVPGKRPQNADLELGELALNTFDAHLFTKRDTGGVGIGTTVVLLTPWTETAGVGIYYTGGNVGLGTTNPTSRLWVSGDINFTGNLYQNGTIFQSGGGGGTSSQWITYAAGISTTSNVGMGTTNPTVKLQVNGSVTLGAGSSDLISFPGRIASNFYPDGDGVYDLGRAPQIGSGANRWRNANFSGKGVFDSGVNAHDLELGVGSANLIYSTSGNLELNSQSGTTNIDDILTVSGNTGIGTVNPTQKLHVQGNLRLTGGLYDENNNVGTTTSVLVSTGAGVSWASIQSVALQGLQGTQGVQGTQGLQGEQGLQGTQGVQGIQGLQGTQGVQGIQGLQGTQGIQGLQGTTGSQGTQGIQGLQGTTGSQGTQGIQGLQGTTGSQGTQGIQGLQGTTGSQGTQGIQGLQGTTGSQGTQGLQGLQGTTGSQGTQGLQGLQGTTGSQGTQGLQGLQGSSAATAITNNTDNCVVTATGNSTTPFNGEANFTFDGTTAKAPYFQSTNSIGDEGGEIQFNKPVTNTSINTGITLDVFQNKVRIFETGGTNRGGYWDITTLGAGVTTNLLSGGAGGAQGTQGIQGLQGTTGSQGTQGIQGLQGTTGSQGTQGIQGLQGTTGSQGTQGIQGLQGTTGSQGTQGIQGLQGTTGSQGTQGIQGLQGTTGSQGTQGIQGLQGTTGSQGTQGIQGLQGTTGSQGTQGLQGLQGTTGSQGTQGIQGLQGTTGSQGTQGLQGLQGTDGTQGTQGIQGLQGTTGSQGTQGLQGLQGTTGSQGTQGLQGLQGTDGTQGTQGLQGLQGTTGSQGTQGLQGLQGTDGTQGTQGIQGNNNGGVTVINDVSTNALRYIVFEDVTSGISTNIGISSTKLVFNPSLGNVGIGSTIPVSTLDVVGTGKFTGITTAAQLDLTANASTDDSVLYLSGAPLGTVSKNGLLGIGQNNFSDTDIVANFTHNVNSYAQIILQNKNSGASASSDFIVNNDRTAGTTYYGDFGINGTTFAGGGPFGDPDGTYLYSAGGTLSLGSIGLNTVRFAVNSVESARFDTSGNLGIGTTIPTSKLHVVGGALITGVTTSTDFNSTSDLNLKTNIQPIENAIDKILQMNGVTFNWKIDNRSSVGVIAQDIEKVFPELVQGENPKTVNYNGIIGLLIEAIKEQQREINSLKEKIE